VNSAVSGIVSSIALSPLPHATMFVKNLLDCEEFIAGDHTRLRELLHPDKQPLALRYSLAHAIVAVGEASTPHALKTSEVYYILQGMGEMHINEEIQPVTEGDVVYIPPNARQFIHNCGNEPLMFLCIVDPAWRAEDEIVFE
jgi:mannose-6-phosphate isomerase-like protein (cupin superfamily)